MKPCGKTGETSKLFSRVIPKGWPRLQKCSTPGTSTAPRCASGSRLPMRFASAPVAHAYAARAAEIVRIVETAFGRELPGLLVLSPSFGDLDGFARYESGSHTVFLGIDFPEADVPYLQALTAHELSHVYRDHSPRVWAHLGKPLSEISRAEYLDEGTAAEHLVSEGLATLFSMTLFPEIPGATHHYYSAEEYEWCRTNRDRIESAIRACLVRDQNVWSFYGEGRAGPGSPSRTQYFWAADVLTEKMNRILAAREAIVGEDPLREVVALHALPAAEFLEFV